MNPGLRKAAESGNAEAQYMLGDLYYQSNNYIEAFEWYCRSARQGHHWGFYNVAKCFEAGHGVERSSSRALWWYKRSAEREHTNEWALRKVKELSKASFFSRLKGQAIFWGSNAFLHTSDRGDACHRGDYQEFRMPDGTVLRGLLVNRGPHVPLLVIYGGQGDNVVNTAMDFLERIKNRSVLIVNYRGYGNSEGMPSDTNIVDDMIETLRQARMRLGYTPPRTILTGYSMGTGVAVQVAVATIPDKLVLSCPYDSIANVAKSWMPHLRRMAEFLIQDTLNSALYAPHIPCPVTILGAEHDQMIPRSCTENLIGHLRHFKQNIDVRWFDADHFNILRYEEAFKAFIGEC